jgi:hypothetical protein
LEWVDCRVSLNENGRKKGKITNNLEKQIVTMNGVKKMSVDELVED